MGGVVRQSCRVERWRGYVASSFYVRLPDGTRLESPSFKWRRASAPPDTGDARAAYDEIAERLGALGWEPRTDGEEWFATEFARFVEAPSAPDPVEPELEPELPLAPAHVAAELVERERARPRPPARVAAESIERELVTRLPSRQVSAGIVEPEPAPSLPAAHVAVAAVEPEPLASVHLAPRVVRERPAPEPLPPAPVVQPRTVPRRISGPSPLQLAVRRAWMHALETTRGLFARPIRMPGVINVLLGIAVVAVAAVVWVVVIHSLTKPPKPAPVIGRPDAVVWGNRVFTSRAEFAHWLKARGLSYSRWAKTHPDGVRIINAGKR